MKFRIWDKHSKCFVSEYENTAGENRLKHFIDANGEVGKIIYPLDGSFGSEDNIVNQNDYVIQRFTDLFDKNNKEIFEGDILTHKNRKYKSKVEFGARLVYRSIDSEGYYHYNLNNGFLLRLIDCDKDLMVNFEFDEKEVHKEKLQLLQLLETEVIGNIFENEELLKWI